MRPQQHLKEDLCKKAAGSASLSSSRSAHALITLSGMQFKPACANLHTRSEWRFSLQGLVGWTLPCWNQWKVPGWWKPQSRYKQWPPKRAMQLPHPTASLLLLLLLLLLLHPAQLLHPSFTPKAASSCLLTQARFKETDRKMRQVFQVKIIFIPQAQKYCAV